MVVMKKIKVLLVEDDEDIGEMLLLSLQSNAMSVTWYTEVMDAQNALKEAVPDVILLDLSLIHI